MALGAMLYAIFLFASPFEHHDLSCELKTPQHCTACSASVLSAAPDDQPTLPDVLHLADAGSAASGDMRAESLLVAARTTGRSPPSAV
ncbi:MAG TPA: hypothetical protein VH583_19700 [Vicinamibacterales bacterium]